MGDAQYRGVPSNDDRNRDHFSGPDEMLFLQNEGDSAMFTYAQCRAIAKQKLAQAEHDPENRRRLIAAANGWLLLASRLNEGTTAAPPEEPR